MKAFTALMNRLDYASEASDKVNAFIEFLTHASDLDKLWAIKILSGKRKARVITIDALIKWTLEISGVSNWLFDQSQEVVKDKVETASLILGNAKQTSESGELSFWLASIEKLRKQSEIEQKTALRDIWLQFDSQERYIFNKLLVGSFRFVLDNDILIKAISQFTKQPKYATAIRFYETWYPEKNRFEELFSDVGDDYQEGKPEAFIAPNLITQLPEKIEDKNCLYSLLKPGIRVQLIIRENTWFLWDEKGNFLNPFFPEFSQLFDLTEESMILEGYLTEVSPPDHYLEKRLKKAFATTSFLNKHPFVFRINDWWEWEGASFREETPFQRYDRLSETYIKIGFPEWVELISREPIKTKEELEKQWKNMRKHNLSFISMIEDNGYAAPSYLSPPVLLIQAILLYAHRNTRGPGFSHFSFGIYKGEELVPIAKLPDVFSSDELPEIETFVKDHTLEKFGPVRTLKPEMVFSLTADSVTPSKRHKAGLLFQGIKVIERLGSYPDVKISLIEDFI